MGYYTRGGDGRPMLVKDGKPVPRKEKVSKLPVYSKAKQDMLAKAKVQAEAAAARPNTRRPFLKKAPPSPPIKPYPVPGLHPSPDPAPGESAAVLATCQGCGKDFEIQPSRRGPKPKWCSEACGKRTRAKLAAEKAAATKETGR